MKIRNYEDLADYLGAHAPTEESVSRRVYKDTACGAWAKFEHNIPPQRREVQQWKVDIQRTLRGPFLRRARRAKGRKWYAPEQWPPELLEFCGEGKADSNGRWFVQDEETAKYLNSNSPGKRKRYWDAEITACVGVASLGVSFGSIVEGTEACTSVHTIRFPCDSDEIDTAIQRVEDEARDIWDETHGCPSCWGGTAVWGTWGEAEPNDLGMRPVDPSCSVCKGQGIII